MIQGIAKKTCDVLVMIASLQSVVVDVDRASFEAGVEDYARLLGQPPGPLEHESVSDTRSVFFAVANVLLEIREAPERDDTRPLGVAGIRLECDDLDQIARRRAADVSFLLDGEDRRVEYADGEGDDKVRTWRSTFVDPAMSRGLPVELITDEVGSPRHAAFTERLQTRADNRGGDHDPSCVVRALDHVVVMSRDIEATRDFYADALGIRLALDRSFEKRGVRLLFFRVGGVTIEIGGRLGTAPDPSSRDQFGGLAWQVVDIDAIHARLSADRFDISEIRDGNKPGTRVCTVRDPVHGVPTLLIEPVG